ncbi:MAG: hypothetical protein IKC73_05860 [Clostridia bacterium]|nr:hypothetical protein [Clostridia bacterium]
MKKRVLSFLLCLLMILPLALVSCGPGEDPEDTMPEEEDLYVKPASLNFYIIGDTFNTETVAEMQEAFNAVSRDLYKTQIHFIFCTEAEYEAVITAKLQSAAASNELPAFNRFENAEVETELDDLDTVIELYPEVYNNQVDILLITGKDMFDRLHAKGYLADITADVENINIGIKSHVNTNLLSGAKVDGRLYAVPNNVTIGTYTYMLINKQLAARYYNSKASDFTKVDSNTYKTVVNYDACLKFANDIMGDPAVATAMGVSEVYPLESTFEFPTINFFPKAGENTLFGVVYEANTTYTHAVKLDNVFNNEVYKSYFGFMLEAKTQGFCPASGVAPAADAMYGIRVLKGDYADRFNYTDDYYIYELDQPRLEDDAPFESMFAVSAFSASVGRSMQIIEDLLCNDSAVLRNILQYGVEGTHYNLNEKGIVERTAAGQSYRMNYNYTGNVILAAPCLEDGMDLSFATYFKQQNDSATRNPLYGLTPELLWERTRESLINYALTENLTKLISADIDALNNNSSEIMKAATQLSPAEKKAELKAAIPTTRVVSEYRDFWASIRADIDPTAEVKEGTVAPVIPVAVRNEVNGMIETLRQTVTDEADAHLSAAADAAATLMEQAMACTTKAEFDAHCESIKRLDTKPMSELGKLLYNSTAGSIYHGMLKEKDNNETWSWTLSGALYNWYLNLSN